jgi:hypothetical protein
MATGTVNFRKIYTRTGLGPGESETRTWNKPPENTVLTYFAYAKPPAASGEHGTKRGTVAITRVEHDYLRDNHDGDDWEARITVRNTGDQTTGYDVWQSWIVPD